MGLTYSGEVLVPGDAEAKLILSNDPLSFWGGYDSETGEIIDRRHPLSGVTGTGHILAIPGTRGSSTTTAVLIEAFRRKTAPAGFLVTDRDTFLALAAVVADEMYQMAIPVIKINKADFEQLESGMLVGVAHDGVIKIHSEDR